MYIDLHSELGCKGWAATTLGPWWRSGRTWAAILTLGGEMPIQKMSGMKFPASPLWNPTSEEPAAFDAQVQADCAPMLRPTEQFRRGPVSLGSQRCARVQTQVRRQPLHRREPFR